MDFILLSQIMGAISYATVGYAAITRKHTLLLGYKEVILFAILAFCTVASKFLVPDSLIELFSLTAFRLSWSIFAIYILWRF